MDLVGAGFGDDGQYEQSLAADPAQAVLHYKAGILLRQIGENPRAARHLEESIRQGFRNTGVHFHLAAAQFAAGVLTDGRATALAMLLPGPPSSAVALLVGRLLFQYLFYKDARDAFETALSRSDESLESRSYLALTNFLLNEHERTVDLLEPLANPSGPASA